MENIENVDNLTIKTIYEMVLEMKSKLDFLESETHAPQSDKAGLYMESIDLRLSNVDTDIESMKLRLNNIEADIVDMKADIKSIQLRLNNIEVEMAVMKTDILNIKADIVEMKKDIATIAREQSKLRNDILREQSKLRDDIYKWGVGLAIGIFVSVCSILSVVVLLVN